MISIISYADKDESNIRVVLILIKFFFIGIKKRMLLNTTSFLLSLISSLENRRDGSSGIFKKAVRKTVPLSSHNRYLNLQI